MDKGDPSKVFDLDPTQKEILEWKHQKRLSLRNEYLREIHDPNSKVSGHLFDQQIQRQYSMTARLEDLFKPNVKNFLWFVTVTFGAMGVIAWRVNKYRAAKEHRYRTGQVSYKDRDWKFV